MTTDPPPVRVLITGGASGIGFATAQQLGRAGARIGVFDLNAGQIEAVRNSLAQEGVESLGFNGDVRRRADLAQAVDNMTARWGGLDALVCAAGILRVGPLATLDMAQWDEVMDVNLKGVLMSCQEAIRVMQSGADQARRRKIVIVASAAAEHPKVGLGAYATSKLALVQLTRVFAAETGIERHQRERGRTRNNTHADGDGRPRCERGRQRVPVLRHGADGTDGRTRRHRRQHRVSLFRASGFHNRSSAYDRRRDDRDVSGAVKQGLVNGLAQFSGCNAARFMIGCCFQKPPATHSR